MYLLHHCLVYVYGSLLVPVDMHPAIEFAIVTVAAAATVLLIHEYGIRRVGALRYLFNGKSDLGGKASPAAASA